MTYMLQKVWHFIITNGEGESYTLRSKALAIKLCRTSNDVIWGSILNFLYSGAKECSHFWNKEDIGINEV